MIDKIKINRLKKKLNIKNKNIEISSNLIVSNFDMIKFSDYIYIGESNKIYGLGNLIIKDNVIIGPNNTFFTSIHDYKSTYIPYGFTDIVGDITIEENVWIGANTIIFPNITIGEGAVVGAGSVVTKDIPALSIVAGNPAKVINTRNLKEYQELKLQNKFYLKKKWGRSK